MLGPQITLKRHLAGSTRTKSSSPTIKGRPFPVCLLLSLAQVRPVTIASAIPASPSRRVSHAAFSYSGRYCAITFQSTKVSPSLSGYEQIWLQKKPGLFKKLPDKAVRFNTQTRQGAP